jgi:Polyketide cyclase / dehydrase and lipid transport
VIHPKATIDVAASPDVVIRFVAEPANAPRWMRALQSAELLTPGPIRRGSRFREVQSAGGEPIETICEVVEYDGATRYAWKSVSEGDASYGGGFTAVPVTRGTELRYEGWATATGRLAEREAAWGRQAQREAEAELAAIKAAVEADDPA